MRETLAIINQMVDDRIISSYAIGGAVGAVYYIEPFATIDLDIFVKLDAAKGAFLISLTPIYEYLTSRGCSIEGEHIVIKGWPVQFLPPGNALEEEALAEAIEGELDGLPIRIMTAEHLAAIALQLGRRKDQLRVLQFQESGNLNISRLEDILLRHGLLAKWKQFNEGFLK